MQYTHQDYSPGPDVEKYNSYNTAAEDEGILHYEPICPIAKAISSESDINVITDPHTVPTIKKNKTRVRAKAAQVARPISTPASQPIPNAAKPTTTAKKPRTVTLTELEVHARLRTRILADTQLYLRILRYEPICFDTFLQLITDPDTDSSSSDSDLSKEKEKPRVKITGALKLQVRGFLDKQVSNPQARSASEGRY